MLEYLSYFNLARPNLFSRTYLQKFSAPTDEDGYGDSPITNNLITDVYLEFITKTRQDKSVEYCKTREGLLHRVFPFTFIGHHLTCGCLAISLSLDNTFKSAGKAVVVDKAKNRVRLLKGGVLSVINEKSEILAWVCHQITFLEHYLFQSYWY